jgi:hypothetical protein
MTLWVFDLETREIEGLTFELVRIARGQASVCATGTFSGLGREAGGQLYAVFVDGMKFGDSLDGLVCLSGTFGHEVTADWRQDGLRVPFGSKAIYSRAKAIGVFNPGKEIPLLKLVFADEMHVVAPVLRPHWTVAEYQQITENRPETVVACRIVPNAVRAP